MIMNQSVKNGTRGPVVDFNRQRKYQITGVIEELRVVRLPRLRIFRLGLFLAKVYQVRVSLSHAQREGFDFFLGEDARHYSLPSVLTLKMSKEHFERLAVGDEVQIPYVHFGKRGTVERQPLQLKRRRLRRVS